VVIGTCVCFLNEPVGRSFQNAVSPEAAFGQLVYTTGAGADSHKSSLRRVKEKVRPEPT